MKKKLWQQYLSMAFLVLLGAICGFVMMSYWEHFSDGTPFILSVAILLLGMYIGLFFHIIVHEAGHLFFGLLTGYRFCSFRIASFLWLKEDGKLRLKRLSIAGTGGQCLMSPPDMKDGKMPIVLYNLGGSVMNAVVGGLFLVGHWLCPTVPLLSVLLLIFGVTGLISAMTNGIPMRMGTVDNDGYNAFALSKNPAAVEAFWIQLKVAEQTARGIRLKDMPAHWFAVPTDEAMKNSMVATCGTFACNRLMDEEKFEEADALMAHLLEIDSGMVGIHRNLLVCERLYLELIGENRKDIIDRMMSKEQTKFMDTMKRFPSVLRTQYALALLRQQDPVKAEKVLAQFEKVAKTYPYPQEIAAERSLLRLATAKSTP